LSPLDQARGGATRLVGELDGEERHGWRRCNSTNQGRG
jgi:hypothetical protein